MPTRPDDRVQLGSAVPAIPERSRNCYGEPCRRVDEQVLVLYRTDDPGGCGSESDSTSTLDYGPTSHVVYYTSRGAPPRFADCSRTQSFFIRRCFACGGAIFFPLEVAAALAGRARRSEDRDAPGRVRPLGDPRRVALRARRHTIFTNFDERVRALLYPLMDQRASFGHAITGYVDERQRAALRPSAAQVAARSTSSIAPAICPTGSAPTVSSSTRSARVVGRRAPERGLTADISTSAEAPYRRRLAPLPGIGTRRDRCESGSSVLDRRGEIRAQDQTLLRVQPGCVSFDEVDAELPADGTSNVLRTQPTSLRGDRDQHVSGCWSRVPTTASSRPTGTTSVSDVTSRTRRRP